MLKTALCAAALTVLASSAMAATTVDVTFTDADYAFYSGSFVASDTNGDGFIEAGEVTSFTTALFGSSKVVEFGDYDIATNTWSATADGYYYLATSGNHTLGLTDGDTVTTVAAVTSVPEPSGTSMMVVGALALGLVARRRRAR